MTRSRFACSLALIATAGIHLAVVPEHQREWPLAAAFFVALTVVELGLAVAVATSSRRDLLLVGAIVSASSAALWLVSRTIGLPIGPDVFTPERIGRLDLIATALELATTVLFVTLVSREQISREVTA